MRGFFCGSERYWNIFDLSVVGMSVFESAVEITLSLSVTVPCHEIGRCQAPRFKAFQQCHSWKILVNRGRLQRCLSHVVRTCCIHVTTSWRFALNDFWTSFNLGSLIPASAFDAEQGAHTLPYWRIFDLSDRQQRNFISFQCVKGKNTQTQNQ